MRKFKAFTLIELIVVIAIFGIIMAGVVQMVSPISTAATNAKVLNNQQTVENAISNYIGENLRYANNLLIVEDGCTIGSVTVNSADTAIDAFFAYNPCNSTGKVFNHTPANEEKVSVIAFDGINLYQSAGPGNYCGRVISSLSGRSGGLDFSPLELASDGSKNQYMVFGNSFYGPADYYIDVSLDKVSHVMNLTVNSDYHYSNSPSSAISNTGGNDKNGRSTYELRNYGLGNYVFKLVRKTGTGSNGIRTERAQKNSTNAKTIYFVFTDEHAMDSITDFNNSPAAVPTPGSGSEEHYTENGANTGSGSSSSTSGTTAPPTTTPPPATTPGGGGGGSGDGGSGDGGSGGGGSGGGGSGSGSNISVSTNVSTDNMSAPVVQSGQGVYSAVQSGDKSKITVGSNEWNKCDIEISKDSGGNYQISFPSTDNYWIMSNAGFQMTEIVHYDWGDLPQTVNPTAGQSYTLSAENIKQLESAFGIKLK